MRCQHIKGTWKVLWPVLCLIFTITVTTNVSAESTVRLIPQHVQLAWNGQQVTVTKNARLFEGGGNTLYDITVEVANFHAIFVRAVESWTEGDRCGLFSSITDGSSKLSETKLE